MLPLRKPRKYVDVYDLDTEPQYVTRYTPTIAAKAFLRLLKAAEKVPLVQTHHVPHKDRKQGAYGYQLTRNWGLLVEGDRISWIGTKYQRRIVLDWEGARNQRTFWVSKRKKENFLSK